MNEGQKQMFREATNAWFKMVYQHKNAVLIEGETVAYLQWDENAEKKWAISTELTHAVEQKVRPNTTVIVIEEFQNGVSKEYFFMAKDANGQYGSLFAPRNSETPTFEYEGGQMISYCLNEPSSRFIPRIDTLTTAAKKAIGQLRAFRLYQETGLLHFVEME